VSLELTAHGITAGLPNRWEGVIGRRPEAALAAAAVFGVGPFPVPGVGGLGSPEELVLPTAHLATVALPADRGDFGSGAVDALGPDDLFVALLEYGPECVGTELFARQGIPRTATPARFNRRSLQNAIPGQAGWQSFFTTEGRAFCLYVVLGRDHDIGPLLRELERVLGAIKIDPAS
jgi:hypothetical protein